MLTKFCSMRTTATKLWRDSASLIILGRTQSLTNFGENYKILSFKRPDKTHFMPTSIVFPGGACEKSDQLKEWLTHFKNFGITDSQLQNIGKVTGNRPPIFQNDDESTIRKEISLRITAIRETFEELGILLCRKKEHIKTNDVFSSCFEGFNKKYWQEVVHNDPSQFLTMCQELEVLPDLWTLFEWSDWLTPTFFKVRRFETAFFLVALQNTPDFLPEEKEVVEAFWKSPQEMLKCHKNEELWLPPPQHYELSRLCNFKSIDDVAEFTKKRSSKGCSLFLPVQYRCADGLLHVLPGDDLYPKNINRNECEHDVDLHVDKSINVVRGLGKNLHRGEYRSSHDTHYIINIEAENGHLNPSIQSGDISKL